MKDHGPRKARPPRRHGPAKHATSRKVHPHRPIHNRPAPQTHRHEKSRLDVRVCGGCAGELHPNRRIDGGTVAQRSESDSAQERFGHIFSRSITRSWVSLRDLGLQIAVKCQHTTLGRSSSQSPCGVDLRDDTLLDGFLQVVFRTETGGPYFPVIKQCLPGHDFDGERH